VEKADFSEKSIQPAISKITKLSQDYNNIFPKILPFLRNLTVFPEKSDVQMTDDGQMNPMQVPITKKSTPE
jgi:hypothetical protein